MPLFNPLTKVHELAEEEIPLTPNPVATYPRYQVEDRLTAYSAATSGLPPTPKTYDNSLPNNRASDPFVDPPEELQESQGLLPFLALGPRLLLTTFSPALIPFVFTIVHIANTRSSTAQLATSLRTSLLSACSGLATGAASIQAIPRYLAMQTNQDVLRATRASVLAVGSALMDCITIIETVLNFIADTYRSLLLCTVFLVVQGTMEVLIAAVQEISDAVTDSLNWIRTEIQSDLESANTLVQKAVSGINSVTSLVDVNLSVPNITIPALSFLDNVTIPTGFEDSLIKLNNSMPTLSELKDKLDELIDVPFEALKAEINTTRLEIAASFNASTFPVPSLKSLGSEDDASLQSALCGDLNTSIIDDTANALYKLGTYGLIGMILVLLAGWCVLAFWQWRRWKALQRTVIVLESEWASARPTNAWTAVAVVEHPVIERYLRPTLDRFKATARTRNNMRWILSYLGHPTMLTLLCTALVGLIAIEIQIAALHGLQHVAQMKANATIAATTEDLVNKMNALSYNASMEYASDMNSAINGVQDSINNRLFGHWVNATAVQLNSTLVTFYSEVQTLLNESFGGTILYNPINTFVYCIVGSKVTNLEKGLTWISEHVIIDLPTVDNSVLQMSNATMFELVAPVSAAAAGSSSDPNKGVIAELVNHFEAALNAEKLVYGILLSVYVILVLIGILIVLWHSGGRERYLVWRGGRRGGGGGPPRLPSREGSPVQMYADEKGSNHSEERDERLDVPITTSRASGSRHGSSSRGSLRSLVAPGNAFLALRKYTPSPPPGTSSVNVLRPEQRSFAPDFSSGSGADQQPNGWVARVTNGVAGVAGGVAAKFRQAQLKAPETGNDASFSANSPHAGDWPALTSSLAPPNPAPGVEQLTPTTTGQAAGGLQSYTVASRWRRSESQHVGTPVSIADMRRNLVIANASSQDGQSEASTPAPSLNARSLPPPPRRAGDSPTDAVSPISEASHQSHSNGRPLVDVPSSPGDDYHLSVQGGGSSRSNISDRYPPVSRGANSTAGMFLAPPVSGSGSGSTPSEFGASSHVGSSSGGATDMAAWGTTTDGGDIEIVDSARGSWDNRPSPMDSVFTRGPSRLSSNSFGGGGALSLTPSPAASSARRPSQLSASAGPSPSASPARRPGQLPTGPSPSCSPARRAGNLPPRGSPSTSPARRPSQLPATTIGGSPGGSQATTWRGHRREAHRPVTDADNEADPFRSPFGSPPPPAQASSSAVSPPPVPPRAPTRWGFPSPVFMSFKDAQQQQPDAASVSPGRGASPPLSPLSSVGRVHGARLATSALAGILTGRARKERRESRADALMVAPSETRPSLESLREE